jgi:hypothetical protein
VADLPISTETNSSGVSSKSSGYSLSTTHKEFIGQRDMLPNDLRAFLTPYSPDKYIAMKAELYLSDTKLSGFGITPDGELISVFSLSDAHEGDDAVDAAIKVGAKYLDCLGEHLRKFYEEHGFEVIEEYPWDEKYRPEGWDEKKHGKLSVYFMELKR